MAAGSTDGTTALDRLTAHYEKDLVCPKCGHEDDSGHWKARTSGSTILYRHVCPACGAIRKRTLKLRE